jgi:predicted nucleotidyltransferase component of viral defense system
MKPRRRNVAASVRDRLLRLARATGQPNGELLDRYCIERLLYRLGRSKHRDRFILKGAMLLAAWGGGIPQRVTRDADLLGFGDSSLPALKQTFLEICATAVEDDGVTFELHSIEGEQIRALEEYVGLRIELRAHLGGAVVRVQIDIGTGDAVSPTEISLPTLLDFPQPFLRAYTRENSLAEKFEAMVKLGFINTRMKDYFDLWHLSRNFAFEGEDLGETLRATFARRGTPLPTSGPIGLSTEFASDRTKQIQWVAFWNKLVRREPRPALADGVAGISEFIMPVVQAVVVKKA